MKKLLIILLIFCMFVLNCRPSADESKEPLKIGLVTWIGYGPFYIAKEKGFFEENGVKVILQRIEGDAERRSAIASGKLDGSALTLDAMIVLRSQNIPVKTVLAIDASIGGDGIIASKSIKTVEELKGKQIAFPTGLPSHFFLYSVLKDYGIKMTDIKPIIMDADKAGAAFIAKQVEVAVTWEPWLSKAKEMTDGHILIDSQKKPGVIEDVLFMREEVIDNRPDDIVAFIKGWYQAVDFVKTNPDESKSIIGKAFGLTNEEVEILLPKVRYEGKKENAEAFGTSDKLGFLYSLYERISEAWLEEGVIPKRDRPEDGIYPNFIYNLR